MDSELLANTGRLDGFLNGISEVDGSIRQYSAFAFAVTAKADTDLPGPLISDFYARQTSMRVESSERLLGGMGELERSIRPYLLRDPFGIAKSGSTAQLVEDRQKYLSFRVLDHIERISAEARTINSVYKVHGNAIGSKSRCVFFCIRIRNGFLILQFNDNTEAHQ
jgi:hypothetical protein